MMDEMEFLSTQFNIGSITWVPNIDPVKRGERERERERHSHYFVLCLHSLNKGLVCLLEISGIIGVYSNRISFQGPLAGQFCGPLNFIGGPKNFGKIVLENEPHKAKREVI